MQNKKSQLTVFFMVVILKIHIMPVLILPPNFIASTEKVVEKAELIFPISRLHH